VAALAVASGCGDHSARPVEAVKPAPPALAFQEQLVKVVRTVSPTVVQIQSRVGLGSGVVYDGNGNVVTNAHVVGTAKKFTVTLADGTHEASLVGAFPADDLAVIRLGGESPLPRPSRTPRRSKSETSLWRSAIRSACARASLRESFRHWDGQSARATASCSPP
jgi:S1-C subfamily serine protease